MDILLTANDPAFGAVIHKAVLQNHINIWQSFNKQSRHLMEIKNAEFLSGADAQPRLLASSIKDLGELDVVMAPHWPPHKRVNPVRQQTQLIINGERYYFLQQAPNFVIPEHRLLSGEDQQFVGLTVQAAFEKHGRTINGQVAPSTAERRPRVLGLAAPRD